MTGARVRSLLLGALVAGIGLTAAGSALGDPLRADLTLAAFALVVGSLLLALAAGKHGLYAGTIERLCARSRYAWLARVAVLATAPFAGIGVAAYAAAALYETLSAPPSATAVIDWRRSAGTGMLGLGVVLLARAAGLGLGLGGSTVLWANLLICSGLALFWGAAGAWWSVQSELTPDNATVRSDLGLLLAVGGAVLVLSTTLHVHHAQAIVVGTAVSLAVLGLVGGPWWLRTRRLLAAERIDRARAQERAEVADHLHDSVLQTLALIQRRSADPAEVSALARRQERELREWLLGATPASDRVGFDGAIRGIVAEIEDDHRAIVELVIVGDAELDAGLEALVAAAREAVLNAVRHAPGAAVSVYARLDEESAVVYVHDRGPGFDLEAIPPERRGIRESIIGRMSRHGGHAEIHAEPGEGCEVILSLPRR